MTKGLRLSAMALAVAAAAACTVHQENGAPALTGPSALAQSVSVAATPDSITQDGHSQSGISVKVIDASGQPAAGVALRLDMLVDGALVDFGTLAARTIVTGADGRATTVYTAPPSPPVQTGTGNVVTIRAIPVGSDAQTALPFTADIRLIPQGVILPPAGTPTASFFFSPTNVTTGLPVIFDASASTSGGGSIASYAWTFGDGATGSGSTITHAFTTANVFNVTLTVTNDRGGVASTTKQVTVTAVTSPPPTAAFNFSPTTPNVNDTVFFNAAASTAAPGRAITSQRWTFGDGVSAGGVTPTHVYQAAGTYTVTLTVTDDLGQSASAAQSVTVGVGLPTAVFTFSPSTPGINQDVFFNASASVAAPGRTLVSGAWDFGDGSTGTGVSPSHAYTRAGTFVVTLKVTDDIGQIGTTTRAVAVANVSAQIVADFTFSPSDPAIGQTVFFDATPSSSPAGIITYSWDFGDGFTATGKQPTHAFGSDNSWIVRLTVTDSSGRTATTTKTVTVKKPS